MSLNNVFRLRSFKKNFLLPLGPGGVINRKPMDQTSLINVSLKRVYLDLCQAQTVSGNCMEHIGNGRVFKSTKVD